MRIAEHVLALGLAQKGDHRDHDQQGLQPLAQQDGADDFLAAPAR